ncbi:hypothetical protein HY995_03290 [Candidatus Micrarchaeota archaeon]|nr:hypothetical protein [Candidatus Micrarchaeota archaeon]
MKIAFVDCALNKLDASEMASQICQEKVADVGLARFTAPEVIKVPLSVKRMLNEGADVALVFLTVSGEDAASLDLIREKLIDVELETNKFAFVTVVFDDEWRTPAGLAEAAGKKLSAEIDLILNTVGGGSLSPRQEPEAAESLGIPGQEEEPAPQGGGGGGAGGTGGLGGLFG